MFPITFLKIFIIEMAELAALDRVLLVVILLGTVFSLIRINKFESKLFFAVFCGVFSLGAINGVLGVNFRYQLPLIPFATACIIRFIEFQKDKVHIHA
jgi:hypothetical protein